MVMVSSTSLVGNLMGCASFEPTSSGMAVSGFENSDSDEDDPRTK